MLIVVVGGRMEKTVVGYIHFGEGTEKLIT